MQGSKSGTREKYAEHSHHRYLVLLEGVVATRPDCVCPTRPAPFGGEILEVLTLQPPGLHPRAELRLTRIVCLGFLQLQSCRCACDAQRWDSKVLRLSEDNVFRDRSLSRILVLFRFQETCIPGMMFVCGPRCVLLCEHSERGGAGVSSGEVAAGGKRRLFPAAPTPAPSHVQMLVCVRHEPRSRTPRYRDANHPPASSFGNR